MFFADGVLLEVVFGRYRSVKNTLSFKERLKEFLLRGRAAFWLTGGVGIVASKEPVTPTLLEQLALKCRGRKAHPRRRARCDATTSCPER